MMETKWLEDFIALARTRSFSKAASLRCVTQPAFSRRIQALEAWLGCQLIDRSSFPTRLSSQGEVFYEQALSMLDQLRQTRSLLRGQAQAPGRTVRLVVPHTLAVRQVPHWVASLKADMHAQYPDLNFYLTASNVHDAVSHFIQGGSDFLACYHHVQEPIELDPTAYEYKVLGVEQLLPYSVARVVAQASPGHGAKPLPEHQPAPEPLFALQPGVGSLPFLLYSRHAYLSRMFDLAWRAGPPLPYHTVLETDMSESLQAMCAAGLGIAWLPSSVVDGTNTLLPLPGPYRTEMEVRLYRRKPNPSQLEPGYLAAVWQQWPCGPLLASMVA